MRIFAKIRIIGYSSFNDYELIRRTDNQLVWAWPGTNIDFPYLKFEVDYDRVIPGSFALKFKPEDLKESQ